MRVGNDRHYLTYKPETDYHKYILNLETMCNDFKSKFNQSDKVAGFLEAKDIIYLANGMFNAILMGTPIWDDLKVECSFASMYYQLEIANKSVISVPAGLQVAIEDCVKRIYVPENYETDSGFAHNEVKPIVSLLSRISTADNTLVPMSRIRVPEEVARCALNAYRTRTYLPDDVYFLYASYDRASFYQFIILYVEKMILAIKTNTPKTLQN